MKERTAEFLFNLVAVVVALGLVLSAWGTIIYVAVHFVRKFW